MKIHTHYAEGFSIMQFNGPDQHIGRLYQEGGQLKFEGNANEAAHQLFKHVIKENNQYLVMVEEHNNQLHAEMLTLEHERNHWKANHDHQVECARVIKTRRDMPIDRAILHEALLAVKPEVCTSAPEAMDVVTSLPTLNHVLAVFDAARKLVQCKGRYHAELNYKALAALFGVDAPEPMPEQEAALNELTALTEEMGLYEPGPDAFKTRMLSPEAFDQVQQRIDEPPAPSPALRELMTREPRYTKG